MLVPPLALFNVVVRNAVPIIGALFFHWSAANLLILYFIDTLLAVGVIAAGFCYHVFPVEEAEGFLLGLALQAIASLVSFRDLVVMLHKYTPDQLGLKRRFAFVFLRWVGMLFVAFTPIPYALGRYGAFVLVIVYIALTIYAELKPDRFLAAFGEADKQ